MPGSPIQTAHSSPFTPSRGATRSSTPYPFSSSTAVSSDDYDISHLGPYGREWVEKYMRFDYRFKDHPQSALLPQELFEDWEEFSFCEAVLEFGAKDYGMTTAEIAMWWERGVEELEAFDSVGSPDIRDLRRLQQRAQEEAGLLAGSPPPPFREYNVLYNRDGDFIGDSSEPRSPRSGDDPRSPIAGPMTQLHSLSRAARDAEHLPVPTPAPASPLAPLPEARPIAPRPRRNTDLCTTSRPYLSSRGLDHPSRSAAGDPEHTGLRPPPTRPRIIIPASSRPSPFFSKDNDLAQGDPVQRRISDPGNRPRRSFFQSLLPGGGPPLQVLRSVLRQQTTATIALLPPVELQIALPQTEAGDIGVLQAQLRSVTNELEEMRRHLIYQATTLQSSREDLEHFGRRVEVLELRNDVDRSMRLPAANAHVTAKDKQPAA